MGTVAVAFMLGGYLATPSGSADRARLIWNASASAPVGLYRVVHQRSYARGDLVLAKPSPSVARLAARRGYLPAGVPLVKRIVATAGNSICVQGENIFIDGQFAAKRLSADSKGRPLPGWFGCRILRQDEVFLLMKGVRASFDGRYFGPTNTSQIIGRLEPLWVR
jgi:conjugative transfer signal peptidase TraF